MQAPAHLKTLHTAIQAVPTSIIVKLLTPKFESKIKEQNDLKVLGVTFATSKTP